MIFKSYKLSEIASVQTGPFGSQLHKEDYVDDGIPIITVEHLGENKILHENLPLVGETDYNRLSKYHLQKDDIVFSRVGSVDRRALVSRDEEGWMFSGRCLRVRVTDPSINPKYLSYIFGTKSFKEYIRSIAVGATMPSINTKILSDIEVVIPPLHLQNRIVDILYKLDLKIWNNESLICNLEEVSKLLFKNWFINFEFPNEEGLPYKSSGGKMVESELGDIPEGWSICYLDKVANYKNGLAMQKFRPLNNETESLPVLKIKELNQGYVDINSDKCSVSIKDEVKVFDGDVIFSWSGTLLIKLWTGGNAGLNQHLFKVTSKEYEKWFYYLWSKHYLEKFKAIAADKATTMGHIKRTHLSESEVLIADMRIMSEANEIQKPLIDNIIQLGVENRRLAELRDTLLPKLISGEMEIPDESVVG